MPIINDYDDNAIIPAGGLPPEDKAPQESPTKIKVGGKEMDQSELIKSYLELEKKLGSQGSELGKYRGQTDILMKQVSDMQERLAGSKGGQQPQNQPPDFDAMKAAITKAMDQGEISVEEGQSKMWELMDQRAQERAQKVAEKAVMEAQAAIEKKAANREAEEIKSKFLKANPDFMEFRESEDAAKIKESNPLHDDMSAYYEWKAMNAVKALNDLTDRVQSGARPKGPVVDKPGSAIRTQNQKPRTFEERRQAALAAANANGR